MARRPVPSAHNTGQQADERSWPARRLLALAVAFVVGALVAGTTVALVTRDDSSDTPSIAGGDSVEAVAESLRQQEVENNRTQTRALTELAEQAVADLTPVMGGLAAALPVEEGAAAQAADAGTVAGWASTVQRVAAGFGEPPSAGTEVSLARSGISSAVEAVGSAVRAYELSLSTEGETQQGLRELASTLRDAAVETWSAAAVQLDDANIEYGAGHVHLNLPRVPGQAVKDPHGVGR
jgi:hypothetical protein